jgi:3-dehydroquinate synthase
MMTIQFNGTPIHVGSLESGPFNVLLEEYSTRKKVIVVDENTHDCCLEYLLTAFPSLEEAEVMLLPAGEENKALEVCYQVWSAMLEYQINRNDLVINLGGGVVTDLGGFIASVYKRGIDFIHIPTSLMGMVDAAIGGKNGVDLNGLKNIIGTITQPQAIFVDAGFLETLPAEEIFNGYAEMLKHALILDVAYWNQLKVLNTEEELIQLTNIIRSIELKKQVVEADPTEKGQRKLLNFGHSLGHALESYFLSKQPIAHGHAVALGMIGESYVSYKRGVLALDAYREIEQCIIRVFPMLEIPEEAIEELIELMRNDKKNERNALNFVLLESIGKAQVNAEMTSSEVGEALLHLSLLAQHGN